MSDDYENYIVSLSSSLFPTKKSLECTLQVTFHSLRKEPSCVNATLTVTSWCSSHSLKVSFFCWWTQQLQRSLWKKSTISLDIVSFFPLTTTPTPFVQQFNKGY